MTPAGAPEATATPGGGRSPGRLRRLRGDKGVVVALAFLLVVVAVAVLAPWIAPYDPADQSVTEAFRSPSRDHLLGTDHLGRDILSRLMYGGRISMRVSFTVVGVGVALALPIGLTIGYRGGRLDAIVMRFVDAGLSLPPIVLALAIAGVRGPGIGNTTIALIVVVVPGLTRFVRGQALALRGETFVEASRSIGTPTARLIATRVLRNVTSPVVVQVAYLLGLVLIVEAGLSYLGLGAQPPQASWGNMLRDAYDTALFTDGWMLVIPGTAIALTVLAFNEVSDGLRDAIASSGPTTARAGRRGITAVGPRPRSDASVTARTVTDGEVLLDIEQLTVNVGTDRGDLEVIGGVDLAIRRGEVLGLAGESGSGKTVTAMTILRLLPTPPFRVTGGAVRFAGEDLLTMPFRELRRLRGNQIGVVFQDPMSSLDPAQTIGQHLVQAQRFHRSTSRAEARERAVGLLDRVGIPSARLRLDDHPHQLSGGMLQRVMIALALANEPQLLVADEPTTALDVTVQAQILDLLRELQRDLDLSILFVTHDLGVIADLCDRVAIMYAGQVVEEAPVVDLFEHPHHPYTEGLLRASPRSGGRRERLQMIPGVVPSLGDLPSGCRFAPRCAHAEPRCAASPVPLTRLDDRTTRCVRHDDLELEGTP